MSRCRRKKRALPVVALVIGGIKRARPMAARRAYSFVARAIFYLWVFNVVRVLLWLGPCVRARVILSEIAFTAAARLFEMGLMRIRFEYCRISEFSNSR